jgi:methylglyoxal synthase
MSTIFEEEGTGRSHPLPVIALIAHDAKKTDLLRLLRGHRTLIDGCRLLATRTTGQLLRLELGLPVELVASGPMGGDLQIGARIVGEKVDAVVFLRDPLTAHPHEPDIQALLKVCDVHQVPVATNLAAAEILLHFLAETRRRGAEETEAPVKAGFAAGRSMEG